MEAAKFTWPVITLRRRIDGAVESSVGTFVVVNDDGWVITAWHIVQSILEGLEGQERNLAIDQEVQKVDNTPGLDHKRRRHLVNELRKQRPKYDRIAVLWGDFLGSNLDVVHFSPAVDLAVVQL